MDTLAEAPWATVFTGTTSLVALILSFLAFKRDWEVRREQLHDRRHAQARLITAWWTRVSKDTGEDLSLKHITGPAWPEEAGYRVWITNNSDEAAYDCFIAAPVIPSPEAAAILAKGELVKRPFVFMHDEEVIMTVGTLPPRDRMAYLLDRTFVSSIGDLTVHFRDAAGRKWRRTGGDLVEEEADLQKRD